MRALLILWILGSGLLIPHLSMAQSPEPAFTEKPTNRVDAQGRRQGLWLIREGGDRGEPAIIELGQFQDGKRTGPWYKMDGHGELISLLNYRFGVLDGEAQYFEQNRLQARGYYRGLNPRYEQDTFLVEDPLTGEQTWRYISTERGTVRHGLWRFYDPMTGRLVLEEEYQIDSLIYNREFPMTAADSLYYREREEQLPHNRPDPPYAPPAEKQIHYGE